jgi:predicted N-formylglutamate amidohydrolase
MGYIVTCEHGSDAVPEPLAELLSAERLGGAYVCRHGYDVGAREVSKVFAKRLGCPRIAAPFSPLVVDCNRPARHRAIFSNAMRQLPLHRREELLHDVHAAHQQRVRAAIASQLRSDDRVIHLAIHSFAPFEPGAAVGSMKERCRVARRTDLGLLYDPSRPLERDLCADWYASLHDSLPMLRVRRNYPVRGTRDGLTTALRQECPADCYLGIELQLNQAWCARPLRVSRHVVLGIVESLIELCSQEQRFVA